jgi:hypothetical protein
MAQIHSSGKSSCPVCGATANNSNIGRDGSPRVSTTQRERLSDDPAIVVKRNRASKLRRKNAIARSK